MNAAKRHKHSTVIVAVTSWEMHIVRKQTTAVCCGARVAASQHFMEAVTNCTSLFKTIEAEFSQTDEDFL